MSEFNLEIAKQLVNSQDPFPVLFNEAYTWLEYSRKDNAKVNFLKCGFIEGVDYRVLRVQESAPTGGLTHREDIYLTTECFKQWGMMCGNTKGKQIRLYFLECEKIARQTTIIPTQLVNLMTDMQRQLNTLTERTQQLDIITAENRQLNNQLNSIDNAGLTHQGCYNIIQSELNQDDNTLITAYDYLLECNQPTEYSQLLARRAASLFRCSRKAEPFKNKQNQLLFERKYLREAMTSIADLLVD